MGEWKKASNPGVYDAHYLFFVDGWVFGEVRHYKMAGYFAYLGSQLNRSPIKSLTDAKKAVEKEYRSQKQRAI